MIASELITMFIVINDVTDTPETSKDIPYVECRIHHPISAPADSDILPIFPEIDAKVSPSNT